MPAPVRPASRLFNFILRHTLGAWVAHRFHARYDADVLADLKPPYLVIGNHTCFWDPFLMSVPIHYPVHFVASDEYFRTPFMRFVFSLVGGIPKTKNTRDTQTVRTLIGLKRAGAVLGLYPEGNRNWDGVTGPVFAATAKLVRKLAIPVVLVTTTGGTLTQPRWGRHWRDGWMQLSYRLLFTPEDCRTQSEQELRRHMVQALAHNDLEAVAQLAAAQDLTVRFTGRRLAERLELLLFQCPQCLQADTLVSDDNRFSCSLCGFTAVFGEDGQFHAAQADKDGTEPLPFANTHAWNRWQCDNLARSIQAGVAFPALSLPPDMGAPADHPQAAEAEANAPPPHRQETPLLSNDGALLQTGGKTGKLQSQGRGTLSLFANRLRFDADEAGALPISLPIPEISGLNIQYNNRVECYRKGTLFRFSFPDTARSVYKWHQALLYAGVPGADSEETASGSPARIRAHATQQKQEEPTT